MKITCPHCSYAREMSEERIPDGTLTARCPQCGERFQFSKDALRDSLDDAERARAVRLGSRKRPARTSSAREDAAREDAAQADDAPHAGHGLKEPRGAGQGERGFVKYRIKYRSGNCSGNRGENLGEDRGRASGARDEARGGVADGGVDGAEDGSGLSFNPWECARSLQEFVSAFYQTTLRVMFAANRFFSGIVPRSSLLALAFFLAVCFFQMLVEYLWGAIIFKWVMPITETTDPQIRHMSELIASQYNLSFLLVRCVMLTAQLYIFAGLLFLCFRIVLRGQVDFTVVLQVLCYAQAPLILSIIPGVGTIVGMLWCLVCAVVGLRAALRITWAQTVLGMLPLCMLLLLSYAKFFSMLGG